MLPLNPDQDVDFFDFPEDALADHPEVKAFNASLEASLPVLEQSQATIDTADLSGQTTIDASDAYTSAKNKINSVIGSITVAANTAGTAGEIPNGYEVTNDITKQEAVKSAVASLPATPAGTKTSVKLDVSNMPFSPSSIVDYVKLTTPLNPYGRYRTCDEDLLDILPLIRTVTGEHAGEMLDQIRKIKNDLLK